LDEPETKIVKDRRKSRKDCKRRWQSLPPTRADAASFRLVGGTAPIAATRHWFLELRWWWKEQA
jgi:hypothetical protein